MKFIRKRLTYANVAMTLALVFAMTGGAYATKHWVITSTKQIKPSVLKQLRGAQGPEGKPGPAGAAGAVGPQGAKGDTGAQGAKGDAGAQGPKGDTGAQGAKGDTGEAGVCSVARPECKLPSGATLTGVYAMSGGYDSSASPPKGVAKTGASFGLRVSPAPTALVLSEAGPFKIGYKLEHENEHVYGPHQNPGNLEEVEEDEKAYLEACPGSATELKAAPGFLCIYEGAGQNFVRITNSFEYAEAPTEFGIVLGARVVSNLNYASGVWAVTAQ